MNTWLHHPEYEYSAAIRNWNKNWHEGGNFCRDKPNVGLLMTMSAGLANPADVFPHIIEGTEPQLEGAAAKMYEAYFAPVKGLSDAAYNGMRRFPLSIPLDSYDNGNAAAQTLHYKILLGWKKPAYFIWGCSDEVFNEAWGRQWASQMNASFDAIPDAGHFLQNTHGSEVTAFVLGRIGKE